MILEAVVSRISLQSLHGGLGSGRLGGLQRPPRTFSHSNKLLEGRLGGVADPSEKLFSAAWCGGAAAAPGCGSGGCGRRSPPLLPYSKGTGTQTGAQQCSMI